MGYNQHHYAYAEGNNVYCITIDGKIVFAATDPDRAGREMVKMAKRYPHQNNIKVTVT